MSNNYNKSAMELQVIPKTLDSEQRMLLTKEPKILYICGTIPCPATYGQKLRSLNIGRLLQKLADVHLVVVPCQEPTQEEFRATKTLEAVG